VPPTADQRAAARRIAAAMAKVGFVLPGTLLERHMRCRNAGCHCHADPPQLHGPYWFWTRKVNAKTVSRVLSAEQVEEYRAWFDNERTLRVLVRELETLSLAVVDADPRTPRRR
jgi:hypothetical protein